ncbi:MAG TPA: DUF542 domain-containing protein [Symbiobacteriaceae bacterium]|nr:DUF542 domain-containing protein [Symbiobacteriaceae bacterium]
MEIKPNVTLNQIIETFPGALKILTDLGFDTCCGGWEEVGPAAAKKGIALDKVIAALEPVVKGG